MEVFAKGFAPFTNAAVEVVTGRRCNSNAALEIEVEQQKWW